jgi:mono/diheme cytochrome c family protein
MGPTKIAAALLALGAFSVWGNGYTADKLDFGKHEFDMYCAVCHGPGGKGDGPYAQAQLLKTKIADLTRLSKKNNGVFPFERVYEVIDGSEVLKAHGTREMPIWGPMYRSDTQQANFDVRFDAEAYVRAHILALTEYVYRLQAK